MTGWDDFEITMTRGDDRAFRFTVKDSVTGDPINLTGYTDHRFLAKKRVEDDDADAIVDLTTGAGITVADAAGGVLNFEVPTAQTGSLGDRRHQLLAIFRTENAAAKIKTVRRGVLVVWP